MIYNLPLNWLDFFNVGMYRNIKPIKVKVHQLALNLGAGRKHIVGTYDLDLPEWDADRMPIPFDDDTVDVIYALHFLEHVERPIILLRECERILKTGGVMNIVVPYYSSQIASVDLDHKHFFTERTFNNLFDNKYYEKGHNNWELRVYTQLIMGEEERNLCLFTQLMKGEEL